MILCCHIFNTLITFANPFHLQRTSRKKYTGYSYDNKTCKDFNCVELYQRIECLKHFLHRLQVTDLIRNNTPPPSTNLC